MKVLIAGEYSGTIRDAFTRLGYHAMSCDFNECLKPGLHYIGDWNDILHDGWDLIIFHPTCTYMTFSGSKHLYIGGDKRNGLDVERWTNLGLHAWRLWKLIRDCPAKYFAIENPIMLTYAQVLSEVDNLPKQTVQPWWFGTDPYDEDNVKKATCWWRSKTLPPLKPLGVLNGSTARPEVHYMGPTDDPEERRMERSKMTPGMATQIAIQWGGYVNDRTFF